MTQQDLNQLAEDYTATDFLIESSTQHRLVKEAYQEGFKKALELVFKSLGETEDQHSFYQIQELEQQFWNLKS